MVEIASNCNGNNSWRCDLAKNYIKLHQPHTWDWRKVMTCGTGPRWFPSSGFPQLGHGFKLKPIVFTILAPCFPSTYCHVPRECENRNKLTNPKKCNWISFTPIGAWGTLESWNHCHERSWYLGSCDQQKKKKQNISTKMFSIINVSWM